MTPLYSIHLDYSEPGSSGARALILVGLASKTLLVGVNHTNAFMPFQTFRNVVLEKWNRFEEP